ncbi:MAG: type I polyketide synthase, partial [Gammaproteobacteria bacterium]
MSVQAEFIDRSSAARDDIAIVGMACRFPGARNYDEYWQSLRDGVFSVTEVPAARWSTERFYSPEREDENKTVSKWGGFIDDIDRFDAALFKISPREAELMDPQQRIMLELAWSCFEDAGYAPSAFRGSDTGVYLGVCNFDYKAMVERSAGPVEAHISTGVHTTLIPNRISYEFDLRGPSIPIDTACSSSLVALEAAVHAMRRGECSAALVGGISILLHPTHFISFSKAGMLSPRGVCRSFDEGADGYVRGEGAGVILIKPLKDALRDGDRIYGLVKGAAVNHGGKVSTVTSPNPFAQSKVIDKAFQDAGISPASVNYIEAHGTGTPKGDPIEMNALMRAYGSLAKSAGLELPERSCGIGSVKTNIGHLEAAAGIAGVIKVLLAMKYRALPQLLHFTRPNPRIKIDGSPFYFVDKAQPWEAGADGMRRAGVSSFGFGGVNAHILLEEYAEPPVAAAPASAEPLLFVLSAKSRDSLQRYARRLAEWLDNPAAHPWDRPFSMAALAWSLQQREALDERAAFEASTPDELKARIGQWLDGHAGPGIWSGSVRAGRDEAERIAAEPGAVERLAAWMAGRHHAG